MTKLCWTFITFIAVFFVETSAQACAVCFGDPTSPLTKGIAMGVWVLMGFIVSVLLAFAILFFKIRTRMKKNALNGLNGVQTC